MPPPAVSAGNRPVESSSAQVKLPPADAVRPPEVTARFDGALQDVPQGGGRAEALRERFSHIDALAELATTSPHALQALGEIFRAEKGIAEEVRAAAGEKLRDLGAVNELNEALHSKDPSLPLKAARLLGEIGPDAAAALPMLTYHYRCANFKTIAEDRSVDSTAGYDFGREIFREAIVRINEK